MALNDLTPQLRTRLNRMERAVGWFVLVATVLLVLGFAYYLFTLAERKGWFVKKIYYQTSIASGAGLKPGDPVKLMGFDVGQITEIEANEPGAYYNITVTFYIKDPRYGYLWSDSQARVAAADFLGHRFLEVTKGVIGVPTIWETNKPAGGKVAVGVLKRDVIKELMVSVRLAMLDTNKTLLTQDEATIDAAILGEVNRLVKLNPKNFYSSLKRDSYYWLDPRESPALTERLETVVATVEKGLPNFLALTNNLARALSNLSQISAHADELLVTLRPTATNLAVITENIREPRGSLGEWLIPTNLNEQLTVTVSSARTNIDVVASNLTVVLENLSGITSNLNAQVQANSNILGGISKAVSNADDLVQGLKRHWLLRSAFKNKTGTPAKPAQKIRSPKEK